MSLAASQANFFFESKRVGGCAEWILSVQTGFSCRLVHYGRFVNVPRERVPINGHAHGHQPFP